MERDGLRAETAAYLKDAMAVLLEVRPANPLLFLYAYCKRAADPESLEGLAWYLLSACPRSRPCWHDNVYSAFGALRRLRPLRGGVDPEIFRHFFDLLAAPLPRAIAQEMDLDVQAAAAGGSIAFDDFRRIVDACLKANEELQGAQFLFNSCDATGKGELPFKDFLSSLMGISSILEGTEMRQSSKKEGGGTVRTAEISVVTPTQLAARGSLTELLSGLGPLPPLDTLREEMRNFSPKDRVSGPQVFAAQWKLQQNAAKEMEKAADVN
eukprot:s13_g11.t1